MKASVRIHLLSLLCCMPLVFPLSRGSASNPPTVGREASKEISQDYFLDGDSVVLGMDFVFPDDIGFGELLTGIEVSIDFSTEFASDIYAILTSPQGERITLVEGLQNEGQTGQGATYTGLAENPVSVTFAQTACTQPSGEPQSGTFLPVQSLDTLIGINPMGLWKLTLGDTYGFGDSLHVRNVTITLTLGATCNLEAEALEVQPVSCSGEANGIAKVHVSSGVAPFTYQWCHGPTTDSLNNLSAGTYTVLVTDHSGCSVTRSVEITVPPTLTVGVSIADHVSCAGFADGAVEAAVIGGTSPFSYEWSTGDSTDAISDLAAGIYRVTVTDANGCQAVAENTVVEPDTLQALPGILVNPSCATVADGVVQASASGGTNPYSYSWSTGDTSQMLPELLPGKYTLAVTDANACIALDSLLLEVEDTISPVAQCQDISVYLDETGMATLTASDLDGGSTDFCGIDSFTVSQDRFDCSQLGNNAVTLFVYDVNGNRSSCEATVTVRDTLAPSFVTCPDDITVSVISGTCVGSVFWELPTIADNCPGTNLSSSHFPGDFFLLGRTTVTYTATDSAGNTATCSFDVIIEDNEAPDARCRNLNLYLDEEGMAVIDAEDLDAGSLDNCEITQLDASQTLFLCEDLGENSVTLRVTDAAGNVDSCTAIVTVRDTVPPTVVCQDILVYLDENGQVSLNPAQLDNGSSDACEVSSMRLDQTHLSCEHIGENPVYLLAEDGSGNTDSCMATVTVIDTIPPTISCESYTLYLDETGSASLGPIALVSSSYDACGSVTYELDKSTYSCQDLGENTVTLTASDEYGNSSTCTATVTVVDTVAPILSCVESYTAYLDGEGRIQLLAASLLNSVSDACGITALELSQDYFTCADVGAKTLVVTAKDPSGNAQTCTTQVTIVDTLAPSLACRNWTLYLDENGQANLEPEDINLSFSDPCGIDSMRVSQSVFSCRDLGENRVSLFIWDVNGNLDSCQALVTVADTLNPIASCQDITVYLDEDGLATITGEDINDGSGDNCGVESLEVDLRNFSCAFLGENTVVLTVTDNSGNRSTCFSTVTVRDTFPPDPICVDIDLYLDETGMAELSPELIYGGVGDACDSTGLQLEKTLFSCEDLGAHEVNLTLTDAAGNTSRCTAIVRVQDTLTPTAICRDITVYLDSAGQASITVSDLDDGSFDNCALSSLTLGQSVFDCDQVGINYVTLIATDSEGNSDTCRSVVTVEDSLAPFLAVGPKTLYLDSMGIARLGIEEDWIRYSDSCGIEAVLTSQTEFTCADLGSSSVGVSVFDLHGNIQTDTAIIQVLDTLLPVVYCRDITLEMVPGGILELSPDQVDAGSQDGCGIDSMWLDKPVFTCTDTGMHTVTLYVQDPTGNLDSCTAILTLLAPQEAYFSCPGNIALENDPGKCSAVYFFQDSSKVACGSERVEQIAGLPSGANFPVGSTKNSFQITYGDGTVDTCSFTVTVLDTEDAQMLIPPFPTVSIYEMGLGRILTNWLEGIRLVDNCEGEVGSVASFSTAEIISAIEQMETDHSEEERAWITALVEARLTQDWVLFPNPTPNAQVQLFVSSLVASPYPYAIQDLRGRMLLQGTGMSNEVHTLSLTGLSKGWYLIQIKRPDGQVQVKKLEVR